MNFSEFYLCEQEGGKKPVVAIYSGRFQPAYSGHYRAYMELVERFGNENVFIGTSNKVEPPDSPLNFKEKLQIISSMFSIDPAQVVETKNPYAPKEILSKFPKETVYVAALGKKNEDRLDNGKYFKDYDENKDMNGYENNGYVYILQEPDTEFEGEELTGTLIRDIFSGDDEDRKEELFNKIYPEFNEEIFNLLNRKIGGQDE